MKNKKGFTLVELLAVIAILAILVIIALPNVMSMFNNAKKSSFETEVKEIVSMSISAFMRDSISNSSNKIYSKCKNENCGRTLDLDVSNEFSYYVEMDGLGNITKLYATDGTYQYKYDGPGLKKDDVEGVQVIAELDKGIIDITPDGVKQDEEIIVYNEMPKDPVSIFEDSWITIENAIKTGNTDKYQIGDTKKITLTISGKEKEYTIRLSNKSTPEECNQNDYSQTACGFVFEFVDIISKHIVNPLNMSIDGTVDGDGNKGGWEKSKIRQYINNDIYNSLPKDLKKIIKETKVISGHGLNDTENFITSDKLYLLSTNEVGFNVTYDTAKNKTRTLDYYNNNNNNASRIKKIDGTALRWWLRTVRNYSPRSVGVVTDTGANTSGSSNSDYKYGVSPAFKIY